MKNLFDISGKVAVVTGGSRGIGAMIAAGYVEAGARTYICSRHLDQARETAEALSDKGDCIALAADLSTLDGIDHFVSEISSREDRIDILVNNAGAVWAAPIDKFPESGWDKVMDLNVKSPFFLIQKFLPLLRTGASADQTARVINIASVDGQRVPDFETYSYSASKAAVIHMTRVLAKRLAADHITVNAIAPGPFPSDMTKALLANQRQELICEVPLGRIGEAEDMAGAAIYLASRAGAYVTGSTLTVDGGWASTV
ncbi:SDR family oxidoreductase [Paremcibacter congregatus]|mgnify:CR=1 FL=1|uniref:3-oxoacyl-ACP reductase n=1 Tax=Paremcibacter congregatus TaxID=2043170 RepID=A0A2G4YNV1_9PROT|nr:SDR family oxidoreductase [Paremcibacter congregatus]PHZ83998.1 3-oxoacyl-ACP reductase [Paremcibacter congregatus]QDE25908.1 SDR family oxidoreductase [Paremcibacter congregatus]|tara:strand:- start:4404 stop:5174 length:771 start_codon:yes stop_codon:yes gene_type:complete